VKASLSVLFDRSTDRETLRQLNYERDARSVVVRRHAGTTCVLWWPGERPPAVLAVLVHGRVVCRGGKTFRQEIRTNDTLNIWFQVIIL
jgi:hypothetical protein